MKRSDKMKLVAHYRANKCVCGSHKHSERWLCLPCSTRLKDSSEGVRLTLACAAHFGAAKAYLALAADGNLDAPRYLFEDADPLKQQLWLVGQAFSCETCAPSDESTRCWEFQGIFTTEALAVAACVDGNYFIAPVELDKPLPKESIPMDGAYYPLARTFQCDICGESFEPDPEALVEAEYSAEIPSSENSQGDPDVMTRDEMKALTTEELREYGLTPEQRDALLRGEKVSSARVICRHCQDDLLRQSKGEQ